MKLFNLFLVLTLSFLIAQETDKKSGKAMTLSGTMGYLSAIDDQTRASYDSGCSVGLSFDFPKELTIFKHKFTTGAEVNFVNLEGNATDDLSINSVIFHLDTKFDKLPIDFSFGTGVGIHPNSGYVGLALLDISHSLPCKKVDISLGLRIQQVINVDGDFNLDFNHNLYGINLKVGKKINF